MSHPQPPVAQEKPHVQTAHGQHWDDAYFWLRERENPEVMEYLKAENAYTDAVMHSSETLQRELYEEMLSRIKETDLSVPAKKGDYWYYSRTEKGKQYGIQCRKRGSMDAQEEIVLDLNVLAQGHEYFSLGVFEVSPDHRYLVYSCDTDGSESFTLQVKDLFTGAVLSENIPNTGTSVEWAADNKTFFYTELDANKRPYRLLRHELGGTVADDVRVHEENDEGFFLNVFKTADEKYVVLDLGSKDTSEQHFLLSTDPRGGFVVVGAARPRMEYSIEHHEGRFLIVTNDEAVNFRLCEAPVTAPSRKNWKDLIPHRENVKLEDVEVFKDYWVVVERENGLDQFVVMDVRSGSRHTIAFEESVYGADVGNNPEYDSEVFRFGYSSLITPGSVYDYHLKHRTRELKKRQEVLGGYDPEMYATERVYAPSAEGASVPVSLVYRKDKFKKGDNPCYLYGYGSYGIIIDPTFSSARFSLINRGIVFAIAHIRGGGDLGRPWYNAGKLGKKKNTFADFIAAAEHLIGQGFSHPKKLVISGGSAGGMLIGAAVNARPELFRAGLLHVPFVDVVNTMLDANLPLTVTEYDEWGNPNEKEAFEYIRSYSPYDNVRKQDYPHLLVTGGLNDPRVQYWEPTKWTAKLRKMKTDRNLLLLKMHMGAGHAGPSGRYEYLKDIAFDYAFVLKALE